MSENTCHCPSIDGYVIPRKSCDRHPKRSTVEPSAITPSDTEAVDLACAWSDYRKDFGVGAESMSAAHKAFKAGWKAAREGDQSGATR